MSAPNREGLATLAAHIAATTHDIGRPRAYRKRRRRAGWLRLALALAALAAIAARFA